jgi:phage N-6-adenine-methyltransferase
MGGIDCDPASCEIANKTVMAKKFYGEEDDGLKQAWGQRVWLNPPYAQPLIMEFSDALASKVESGEVQEAIVVVNNATETYWFNRLLDVASAACFPKGRIKFINEDGIPSTGLQGSAILYVGQNAERFSEEFKKFGRILYAEKAWTISTKCSDMDRPAKG